jgi:hypothetical protein
MVKDMDEGLLFVCLGKREDIDINCSSIVCTRLFFLTELFLHFCQKQLVVLVCICLCYVIQFAYLDTSVFFIVTLE